MNDDLALATLRQRLAEARDALTGEHMTMPASEIFARHARHRARRWRAATAAACAAAGVAVTLALAPAARAGRGTPSRNWPHGRCSLTPTARLPSPCGTPPTPPGCSTHSPGRGSRRSSAGKDLRGRGPGQPLLDTTSFMKGSDQPGLVPGTTSYFAVQGGSGFRSDPDLDWSWTVIPGKIPHDGHFVISVGPGALPASDLQAVWEFARTSAPVTCAGHVQP